ncbi:MAG: 2-amino-4-hydroxy-6-hydroxymethyldihydropteridine diphosphokinase [Lachnospiraceae bacterium]|jgi:dihydroneopterin aldolase/2-amino-4-hydroxy-6-hydroxymethyldihydropteridine diphosphokinase|nr:2-amino-4-hydroxy-6-hydroxymethyldihydropteridine diphosphokinase [Lachnospiraceae bacterium]
MHKANRDTIIIKGLEVFAYHGVHEQERKEGQLFRINAILYTDLREAGQSDELDQTTNYGTICRLIDAKMREQSYQLIEAAAESLAHTILTTFERVEAVDIEIGKPQAPIPLRFECVSVRLYREWHPCFLGVGSNLGDRLRYIHDAIASLKSRPDIRLRTVSTIRETKPFGVSGQGEYQNAVIQVDTILSPMELLETLHTIEANAKRERGQKWAARTLDLDILLYDDIVMNTEELTIPHAQMTKRCFVMEPMAEIAPFALHPVLGVSMQTIYEHLRATGEGV